MNINIYEEKYKIFLEDVDENKIYKISAMFDRFHEAANHSLKPMNLDRESLEKREILWVLAQQNAEIIDLPRLNEMITIKTWVGNEIHNFIPRFYQIENNGKVLVKASSIWAIIDKSTRKTLVPSKSGVHIDSAKADDEISLLKAPKIIEPSSIFEHTVSIDNLDFNNHMNNAQYLEIIDSYNPFVMNEGQILPRKVIARYSKEAFLGDVLTIKEGVKDSSRYYTVDSNRGNHLKLSIEY